MKYGQNQHIEEACTAMAAALAKLVTAVGRQAAAPTSSSSAERIVSGSREAQRLVTSEPTSVADALGVLHERIKPGERINVYLAGSRGCGLLAKIHGSQIMAALGLDKPPYVVKCGTTTGDLAERLRQIGQDGYGAAVRTRNGVEIESGFSAWIAHTISTSRLPREPSVKLMPRIIAIDLPPKLTRRAFDAALHRALKRRSLASIPDSKVPRRFVAYDLGETRVNAATELYALSPHDSADGDLLLDAIEDILGKARVKRA